MCAFLAMCAADLHVVMEVVYHKWLSEIIWLEEVARQKAVISCSAYAVDAANDDQKPCKSNTDMHVVVQVVVCKA